MKKIIFLLMVLMFTIVISKAQTITWGAGMNVAASGYSNLHPRIVTDGSGNPLVIWGRSSDQSVFFSRWNGTAFTTPVKVNSMLTVATQSWMGPDIASKGDTVYVVMKQTPEAEDTSHIFIARSFNGGLTFSSPMQVDNIADSISRFPVVTTDAIGNPLVGFMKFDASLGSARWAVAKSGDFGSNFSTDVKASGWSGMGALVCDCCPGSIICSDNNVAMLYRDNLSNIRDSWAGISSDGGNSFSQGIGYDQGNWNLNYCPSTGPDGIIIGDTLYTTYMSGASGDELVYFNKSSLSSPANSAGTPITGMFSGLTIQNFPRMAGAGKALAIVWKETVNGSDNLALRFSNNITSGLAFASELVDQNNITNTDVALTDGNIFVVWQDANSGTVKYRRGTFPSSTGVEEKTEQNLFSIFPNPADDYINIQLSSLFQAETMKIIIVDITGKEIVNKQIQPLQNNFSISTKGISNGMYFITFQSGKTINTQKIIIN